MFFLISLYMFNRIKFTIKDGERHGWKMHHLLESLHVLFRAWHSGHSIGIHCINGANRSGMMVVAFVMMVTGDEPTNIYRYIKKLRRLIDLDGGVHDGHERRPLAFLEQHKREIRDVVSKAQNQGSRKFILWDFPEIISVNRIREIANAPKKNSMIDLTNDQREQQETRCKRNKLGSGSPFDVAASDPGSTAGDYQVGGASSSTSGNVVSKACPKAKAKAAAKAKATPKVPSGPVPPAHPPPKHGWTRKSPESTAFEVRLDQEAFDATVKRMEEARISDRSMLYTYQLLYSYMYIYIYIYVYIYIYIYTYYSNNYTNSNLLFSGELVFQVVTYTM